MKKRFSFLGIAILVAALALTVSLAACGEQETTTTAASQPPSTQTTQAPTTATTQAPSTETTAGKAKVLRLAAPWPLGDPVTDNIQEFVDKFNAQAGGKYVIELHPGGSLLAMQDEFEAVKTGGVEMAGWPIAVFASVVPIFNLAELPFAVNSIEADAAYNAAMSPLYDQALAQFGIKNVFNFTCQGGDVISVKPVRTLEDWKGLLCQTISPVTAKIVELLGGSGVAIDWSEGYQALSKKVVEATVQSGSMVIQFKLNEVAKYVTRAYLYPAAIGIYMNKKVYEEMPPDIQQLVDKLGKEAQESTNANMVKLYHSNYDKMAELGMEIYPLPKAERDRWGEKLKPFAEELLGKVDKATADQVRQTTQQLDQQFPYTEK